MYVLYDGPEQPLAQDSRPDAARLEHSLPVDRRITPPGPGAAPGCVSSRPVPSRGSPSWATPTSPFVCSSLMALICTTIDQMDMTLIAPLSIRKPAEMKDPIVELIVW